MKSTVALAGSLGVLFRASVYLRVHNILIRGLHIFSYQLYCSVDLFGNIQAKSFPFVDLQRVEIFGIRQRRIIRDLTY